MRKLLPLILLSALILTGCGENALESRYESFARELGEREDLSFTAELRCEYPDRSVRFALAYQETEEGETVTIPDPLVFKYNLHGYYYFYRHVSLDQHNAQRHLLTDTELGPREWEGQYREVPLPTTEYRLYELAAE